MIKVGVTGCNNLRAAELVRLLINHPDVQLQWVTASCEPGRRVDSIVPGIIGECDLLVADNVDCDVVDLVFLGAGMDQLPVEAPAWPGRDPGVCGPFVAEGADQGGLNTPSSSQGSAERAAAGATLGLELGSAGLWTGWSLPHQPYPEPLPPVLPRLSRLGTLKLLPWLQGPAP